MSWRLVWRRSMRQGGEIISPEFDDPREAGLWRAERGDESLTLICVDHNGERASASAQEVATAIATATGAARTSRDSR